MKYEATITVLWAVSWPVNEYKNGEEIFFEEKEDAEKVASIPLGWYGTRGDVTQRDFVGREPIPSYANAQDWANDNLTLNQARKYGFVV